MSEGRIAAVVPTPQCYNPGALKTTFVSPKRPVLARVLLYGALVAAAVVIALPILFEEEDLPWLEWQWWYRVDWAEKPEVQLLQEYVRIDTSHLTGNEIPAAEWLAARLAEVGIEAEIERIPPRYANLWAIVEGEDPRAIVLHHHIDVDDVHEHEEQFWRYPPFSATLEPPWIYGRGVFDMKSVAVAQLVALQRLVESGEPLRRSVIFLATSSEEIGSELGTRRILAERPELVERFGVVLTEGGVVEATDPDDAKYWGIEFAQKSFGKVEVLSDELEPLVALRRRIRELGRPLAPRLLTPPVEAFLPRYGPTRSLGTYRELLAEPERIVADPETFLRLTEFQQALFRNEAHALPPAPRADGGYAMKVFVHLLPGTDFEETRRELLPEALFEGFATRVEPPPVPFAMSPPEHPAVETMIEVVEKLHPDTVAGPYFLPWAATDARFFRAAGIPTYGFSPFLIFTTDTQTLHGPNERIALPGYVQGVELTSELLRRLATDEEWDWR